MTRTAGFGIIAINSVNTFRAVEEIFMIELLQLTIHLVCSNVKDHSCRTRLEGHVARIKEKNLQRALV
jgi:hypothetical protein